MESNSRRSQDEAAISDVLGGVYEAWNDANPAAFVASYLDDASAVLPGAHMKSKAEIEGAMAYSFAGPLKGTRSSGKTLDVRFVSDETAVVISEAGVLLPGEIEAPPERTSLATWVIVRQDGHWRIAAYSSSPSVMPAQA